MAGRPPSKKCLSDALRIAVNEPDDKGVRKIRRIADQLVSKALEGDMTAIKEVFDRLEGKPHQTTDVNVQRSIADLSDAELIAIATGGGEGAFGAEDGPAPSDIVH